jgi:hypothetical protein
MSDELLRELFLENGNIFMWASILVAVRTVFPRGIVAFGAPLAAARKSHR